MLHCDINKGNVLISRGVIAGHQGLPRQRLQAPHMHTTRPMMLATTSSNDGAVSANDANARSTGQAVKTTACTQ